MFIFWWWHCKYCLVLIIGSYPVTHAIFVRVNSKPYAIYLHNNFQFQILSVRYIFLFNSFFYLFFCVSSSFPIARREHSESYVMVTGISKQTACMRKRRQRLFDVMPSLFSILFVLSGDVCAGSGTVYVLVARDSRSNNNTDGVGYVSFSRSVIWWWIYGHWHPYHTLFKFVYPNTFGGSILFGCIFFCSMGMRREIDRFSVLVFFYFFLLFVENSHRFVWIVEPELE